MINLDNITRENMKKHNPSWLQILDYPYIKKIIGGSGSGKNKCIT